MRINQEIGKLGENTAEEYLKKNKYKIVERNFRCNQGEIDIIAFDEETKEQVFVEVKTRTTVRNIQPREAVNLDKQKHIKRVASYYNYKYGLNDVPCRFDIIEVYINNAKYNIEHIKGAFE